MNEKKSIKQKIYNIDNSLCLQNITISPIKGVSKTATFSSFYDDYLFQIRKFHKPITRIFTVFYFFLFTLCVNGQITVESPHAIAEKTKFNYEAYLTLQQMNSIYCDSNSKWERSYTELMAVLESRYGKYIESINKTDKYYPKSRWKLSHFPNIKLIPMSQCMDSLISLHQVTMINEEHFNPVYRAIAYSFLETCYKYGYRYFAVEALKETDLLLNKRKYLLSYETGFYTDEPIFGDLLRQALKMGYTLIPYDTFPSPDGISRDEGQALNIINQTLAKDSSAKILVLGGMGHIFDDKRFYTMGRYFKEHSQIDPLTINFLYFKPRYNKEYEGEAQSCFLDIADSQSVWEPFFLYDTTNDNFKGIGTDIIALVPRTVFLTNDIPSWKMFNKKVLYFVDKSILQENNIKRALVSAYLAEEGEKSIPIDQVEVTETDNEIVLVLYKDKYLLHFDDGKTVKKFKITVK